MFRGPPSQRAKEMSGTSTPRKGGLTDSVRKLTRTAGNNMVWVSKKVKDTKSQNGDVSSLQDGFSDVDSSRVSSGRSRATSAMSGISRCSTSSAYGSPFAHLGFEGARHLHPERLPSAKSRRERAVSFRMLDYDDETIEQVQQLKSHLRRLDMSNIKLTILTMDMIENLHKLEKLDAGFNQLSMIVSQRVFMT